MSSDLQTLGQEFASKREELKISLKEVESATSIRRSYLEAIEAGQMDRLISPVYAQGFVRQYAAYLGIDGDRIISEHSEVFKKPIQQEFFYGIGGLEKRSHSGTGVRSLPNIVWAMAFGGVLIAAYFFARALELL